MWGLEGGDRCMKVSVGAGNAVVEVKAGHLAETNARMTTRHAA
jgi:hypothetical protein